MLILNVCFTDILPIPKDENKPLYQMGQMYGRLYSFLHRVTKEVVAEMERQLKADEIKLDVIQWHGHNLVSSSSKPEVRYSVTEKSCTCPDYVYRHQECKHIKAFKKSLPACPQPVVNLSEREKLALEAKQAREDLGC